MDKVSVLYLRFLEGVTYTEETATISFSPLFEIPEPEVELTFRRKTRVSVLYLRFQHIYYLPLSRDRMKRFSPLFEILEPRVIRDAIERAMFQSSI